MFARYWKVLFGAALGLVIGLVIGVAWGYMDQFNSSSEFTCTRCRAIKHAKTTWGFCLDQIEETGYTRWYQQTQPAHVHHWGWCGSSYRGGIVACGVAHPVWSIPEDIQKEFVETSDPQELARFYSLLESPDYDKQEEAVQMAYCTDLPDFDFNFRNESYRADSYIRVANTLQTNLGERRVGRLLLSLARDAKRSNNVFVLCRMLYVPKGTAEFRRPMIGGASFLGGTDYTDWPVEPIALVDGVPFLIVRGYYLAGLPEPPEEYVKYCLQNCDWNPVRFQPRSEQEKIQALEKLLASPRWKRPLEPDEKEFLASQIK